MKTLTVFTPTYNRAYCLHNLYKSLLAQSCKDFVWLIIDDGSSDGTDEIVSTWVNESLIEIRYVYKENGGMHTAHNKAYEMINTEINTCIDSDDLMPKDAVDSIVSKWALLRSDRGIAGIVGLDEDLQGNLLGTPFPENEGRVKLSKLYHQCGLKGDKKLVYRSSITGKFDGYPEYIGEKLVPLSYLYTQLDKQYDLVCFNEYWVSVDYQSEGSSNTILRQYFESPKGFRSARLVNLDSGIGGYFRFKNLIHLGLCNIILKEANWVRFSPMPLRSLFLLPLSLMLFVYLKMKVGNVL